MQVIHALEENNLQEIILEQYHLLIYISSHKLIFSIFNPVANKFVTLKSFQDENIIDLDSINNIRDENPELSYRFAKINIAFSNSKFTLVPRAFFKNGYKEDYYKINFKQETGETIHKDFIPELDSQLVYGLSRNFTSISSSLKIDKTTHASSAFIKSILTLEKIKDSIKVFIDIDKYFFKIAVFKGKLVFLNSFNYKAPQDLLYHTINISKQFNIDPNKDKYYLTGSINRDSKLYKLLFNFIRYPILNKRPSHFNYSNTFDEVPSHLYYNLFAIALCE